MNESISKNIICKDCKNAGVCVINGLNENEIREVSAIINEKRPMSHGVHLFHQGDACNSLYIVKSGSFRSYMISSDGMEQTIGFYLPGDLIGLDSLNDGTNSCSVEVLETSTVCELPLPKFLKICNKSISLQSRLFQRIGKQISLNYNRIVLLAQRSAMEKTANFLYMVSTQYGSLGYSNTFLKLTMPRRDIANFLGLTIETLSRQLAMLNKMHIINVEQRWEQIKNMEALKSMVEKLTINQCP